MSETSTEQSRGSTAAIGLITAAIGLYFTLVGLGLVPPPGRAGAPGWVVVACGLVFLLGGLTVTAQAVGRADAHGELPPDAPLWTRILQQGAVLVIVGCFASIGTWIAVFGHAERFSGPVMLARIGFGLGALIMWLFFVALVRRAVRQWRGGAERRA